jgi:hypothetical protein
MRQEIHYSLSAPVAEGVEVPLEITVVLNDAFGWSEPLEYRVPVVAGPGGAARCLSQRSKSVTVTTHVALPAINVAGHNKVAAGCRPLAELRLQRAIPAAKRQPGLRQPAARRRLETPRAGRRDRPNSIRRSSCAPPGNGPEIVAGNPFPDEAKRDPGHLVVMSPWRGTGRER